MTRTSQVECLETSSLLPAQCNTLSFSSFFRERERKGEAVSIVYHQGREKRNILEQGATFWLLNQHTRDPDQDTCKVMGGEPEQGPQGAHQEVLKVAEPFVWY